MVLKEALANLMRELVVEKVVIKSSLAFYNRLFLVPKPNKKWRPILDLSQLNRFLNTGTFKMETPESIRLSLKTGEWVTRCLLPYPYCPKVKEVSPILPVSPDLSVHSPTVRIGHGSSGVHQGGQGSKTHGSSKGYQDPPVPRRLVTESPFPRNLPTTYPYPLGPVPKVGLGGKHDQVGINSPAGLQFRRLPVRPDHRSGSSHSGPVDLLTDNTEIHKGTSDLNGQTVHVPDRPSNGYRKAGMHRPASHEAHSVASKEALAHAGGVGKSHSTLISTGGSMNQMCSKGNPCILFSTQFSCLPTPQTKAGAHT